MQWSISVKIQLLFCGQLCLLPSESNGAESSKMFPSNLFQLSSVKRRQMASLGSCTCLLDVQHSATAHDGKGCCCVWCPASHEGRRADRSRGVWQALFISFFVVLASIVLLWLLSSIVYAFSVSGKHCSLYLILIFGRWAGFGQALASFLRGGLHPAESLLSFHSTSISIWYVCASLQPCN